jgi:exopolysaccharide biosynthesis protein
LPNTVHVCKTTDSLDGKPNIAFYVMADLKDMKLDFTADTTRDRRVAPQKFYERNDHALVVVNCTFFSYETNRSLNTVIKDEEERMFTGKAIEDKHPRTAMGYTKDNKLVILLIQGRFPGIAEGATLTQEAQILKNIGCFEALNLDGGGSSCMLVNGNETIKPSDKEGQRPVPAVFLIRVR